MALMRRSLMLAFMLIGILGGAAGSAHAEASIAATWNHRIYMPLMARQVPPVAVSCAPISEESYSLIPLENTSLDPGTWASEHPDLNLALRGYREVYTPYKGLVDYSGDTDWSTPRLQTLFGDQSWRGISRVYQVYQWDGHWPGTYGVYPITKWDVTLIGLNSQPGEKLHVPYRPADIYQGNYVALVLYADAERITLQYTRNDYIPGGYTVHIEGLCVEPRLLALYNQVAGPGRTSLPGIRFGQAIGRAAGSEVGVAIRDRGEFMDPRSRKDWWQGLVQSAAIELSMPHETGESPVETQ